MRISEQTDMMFFIGSLDQEKDRQIQLLRCLQAALSEDAMAEDTESQRANVDEEDDDQEPGAVGMTDDQVTDQGSDTEMEKRLTA
jgi:hypothetical protein